MSLALPPSSGLALHLAAWWPNAEGGAGLQHGQGLPSWKNRGSGVADATQATAAHQPTFKTTSTRWPAVAFDSISDRLTVASSASTLKALHETATFDVFVCLRAAKNTYGVVAGSAFNSGESGFLLERNHLPVGSLAFWLFCGGSGYRICNTFSLGVPDSDFEPGVVNKMLFRGAGSGVALSASQDFTTFLSGGGAVPALPTGNMTNDLSIGAFSGAHFFGGDLLDLAIYTRNLSAGELATMATYYSERYGA